MSESESTSEQQPVVASTATKIRKSVLYGLLTLMIVAFLYDYGVARAGVEQAYDALTQRQTEVNGDPNAKMTDKLVREVIGCEPSTQFSESGSQVEVYSWTAGLPFKEHRLFVVYQDFHGDRLMVRASKYVFDTKDDVFSAARDLPYFDELKAAEKARDSGQQASSIQSGGPGGGGGGRGEGGRGEGDSGRQFNPEEMFARTDANGDGKITEDEVSGWMASRILAADADKDGSITRNEFFAGIAEMRGRRERGENGGRPGGGRGNRRRPEMDDLLKTLPPEVTSDSPSDEATASESSTGEAPSDTVTSDAEPTQAGEDDQPAEE